MIGHDQLTKDLFQTFFADLLQMVVPEFVPHLDLKGGIRFLRGEHFTDLPQGRERRLDLVAEVKALHGPPTPILVHVEPENKARSKTPERLWRYKMQLKLRHGHPVIR